MTPSDTDQRLDAGARVLLHNLPGDTEWQNFTREQQDFWKDLVRKIVQAYNEGTTVD
jgi:hypothetical protein